MTIKREYPAYAGMITTENGRTVIDKAFGTSRRGNVDPVWDSDIAYSAGDYVWFPDKEGDVFEALEATSAGESPDTHSAKWSNINAEWAGNDKPELNQTLEGKFQTCVEKEATNLLDDPLDLTTANWEKADIASITDLGFNTAIKANEWEITAQQDDGTTVDLRQGPLGSPVDSDRSISFFIRAGTHSRIQINFGSNSATSCAAAIIELSNGNVINTRTDSRSVLFGARATKLVIGFT